MIEVISATRLSQLDFWTKSALGLSLQRIGRDGRMRPSIAFENRRGLSTIYNEHIATATDDDHLVFVHDDVWIEDLYFQERVLEGTAAFDVIGVAGNRRWIKGQSSWGFLDAQFRVADVEDLSGAVAHGPQPFGKVSRFGPVPLECEVLDGLFMAASAQSLRRTGVRFDEQFAFHFYDLDFCRSARHAGLRLGTWGISMTHQSKGGYNNPSWRDGYARFSAKWAEIDGKAAGG